MKTKYLVILGAAGAALALTSCGTSDQVTITDAPPPPVVLSNGMTKTASGLQYQILHPGTGATATAGKLVTVAYVGKFANGKIFDQSTQGNAFEFALGTGWVIKGWDEGLEGMKVGEVRKLIIPPELGYGAKPSGAIPGNSTLVFEIQLLDVK